MTTRTKKPATSAEVLEQLQLAHEFLANALLLLNADQKMRWSRANVLSGMNPEDGITGFNARMDVIERAGRTS